MINEIEFGGVQGSIIGDDCFDNNIFSNEVLKDEDITEDIVSEKIKTENTNIKEIESENEEEQVVEKFEWSFSKISKMLESPVAYYKRYILGEKDQEQKYFTEGKLIHYLLLENSNYRDQFAVMPSKVPSDKLKTIMQYMFDKKLSLDDDEALLEVLKTNDLYQKYKVETQLSSAREGREYFEFLGKSQGKTIVDLETMNRCISRVAKIKENKEVMDLISICDNGQEPRNEIELHGIIDGQPVHGILDNLVAQNDVVIINDFKTTSKTIQEFEKSFENYRYGLQAALYLELAKQNVKGCENFKVHFIVFDRYDNVYAFPVSKDTLDAQHEALKEALKECAWHRENDNYTLPLKYILRKVVL